MCICECVLHMSNTQPIETHYKFFTSSTYCAARCLVVVIASAIIYALTLRLTLSFFPTCTFAVAAVFFTLFILPLLLLFFFSSFLSSIWIFTYRPHFYWFVVVVVAAVILFSRVVLAVDHSISFHGLVWILRVVSHILSSQQYKPSTETERNCEFRFFRVLFRSTKFVYIFFSFTTVFSQSVVCVCYSLRLFFARFNASFVLNRHIKWNVFVGRKQIELIIPLSWSLFFFCSRCSNVNFILLRLFVSDCVKNKLLFTGQLINGFNWRKPQLSTNFIRFVWCFFCCCWSFCAQCQCIHAAVVHSNTAV